jgi:ribulose-5-phosphate 4-epimerase/fuculose-1-phosphate aldolase
MRVFRATPAHSPGSCDPESSVGAGFNPTCWMPAGVCPEETKGRYDEKPKARPKPKFQENEMIDPVETLKEKIVLACKVLQHQRLLDVYGHVTARLPDGRILSTPHMPPGKVALRDLIVIDMNGQKLEGLGEPNSETPMHTSIYKARPDVQCILHYHADELVVVAASAQGIKVIANCGVHFYRGTPIYDSPVLIRNHQLGDKVAATLGDHNAVLLRGHGGTVVANDLDTLLRLGIDLVRSAKIQIMASSLGSVKTHSQDECEQMVKGHDRPNANRRYIDYYISEVVD